jgi:ATPase subunit of ABC transporter with duplicated ATPase domains
MSALVTLDAVTVRTPDGRTLFENLTLALGREKAGLVGRNGVGKSTLLRVILGEIAPASGSAQVAGSAAMLRQTMSPPPGSTLADLMGVAEKLAQLGRIEQGEATAAELDLADWTLPQRIAASVARVGLGTMGLERPAASLSGGQITRAALAGLLVGEPDLILLDEPTNNLDAAARAAVVELLEGWTGGALVVSHDRTLLRRMDRIIELSGLGARLYGGSWDGYVERRAAEEAAAARRLDAAERQAVSVEREIQRARQRKDRSDAAGRRARLKGGAPKMVLDGKAQRAEATGARQSRLAERQREASERELADARARVERVRRLAFGLPSSGLAAGKRVLTFEDVDFAWPGSNAVLSRRSFHMIGPERVALVGPNGAGKSTLIRLATGELQPARGRIALSVRAALLDQHAAILDNGRTLLENFRRLNPTADDNTAHAALARFLFRNTAALKTAGTLSAGERLRAALAAVLLGPSPPQLLILDEPTNYLDLDSIEAVEGALAGYDGALLLASHDDDFLAAIGVTRRIHL